MYTYGKTEMEQVVWGAALLGSGGGGSISLAQAILAGIPDGAQVTVIDEQELGDRSCSVAAFLGAPTAGTQPDPSALISAYEMLGGSPCVIPGEIGPVNSLSPMLIALAKSGVVVANGDAAGRALPKISMATFNDKNVTPAMAISNGHDVNISISTAVPIGSADALLRAIVSSKQHFGQVGGLALWPMSASVASAATIWGTLEQTRQLGEAILTDLDLAALEDKLTALGWPVIGSFTGVFKVGKTITAGGFDVGSSTLTGAGADAGQTVTIFSENENMTAWNSNSRSPVPAPYSICFWDDASQRPFTNVEAPQFTGKTVTALFLKPRDQLTSQPYAMQGFSDFLVDFGYAGQYHQVAAGDEQPSGSFSRVWPVHHG